MRIPHGLRAAAGVPTGGDLDVTLLLHGNGTNGSTTFTDSSLSPFTVTGSGNAQISTVVKKYGTGSMAFDGTGDYLTVASSSGNDAFSGDFTFECWYYSTESIGNFAGIFSNASFNSGSEFTVLHKKGQSLILRVDSSTITPADLSNLANNTWYHIAVTREANSVRYFLNGVASSTITTLSTSVNGNYNWTIGGAYPTDPTINAAKGYIDDLRIVKGTALYTSNFTPPTAQLPDP